MPHKDPEVRRAYHVAYKRRNRHRYAARQKATDAARHANERAARYGAPGRITIDEAAAVLAAERCRWCGTTTSGPWWTIDHVEPLHAGGANLPANLVCACHACNVSKYRADRPGRWSRAHDSCTGCGTTERPHLARGLCGRCYGADHDRWRSRAPRPAEIEQTLNHGAAP